MRFFDRNGTSLASAALIQDQAVSDWHPCTIYNIDGVIDIILISHDGDVMSVEPTKFKPFADSNGTTPNATLVDSNLWCTDDVKVPIDTYKFATKATESNLTSLNSQIATSRGAWGESNEKRRKKIENTSGIWKTLMTNHPKNNNYFRDECKGCTEFSILFGDVSVYSWLMLAGYHFFSSTFTFRSNWLRFESNSNDHDSYLMVMYITIPQLMLERNMLSNDPTNSVANALRDKSKGDIAIKPLIQAVCQSGPLGEPDMFLWSAGDYYMGDCLYSAYGSYKFLIQGDGNLVLYQVSNNVWTPKWSTNTSNAVYARPRFTIDQDGKMTISGTIAPQTDGPKSFVIGDPKSSNGGYLIISPNGELIVKERKTGYILWSMTPDPSSGNNTLFSNYFENGFRFESPKDYPVTSCIYSPNLLYSLCLQEDGNFVLTNIIKNQVVWHSKTYGKGVTRLSVQKDGNVVLYTKDNGVVWSTGTFQKQEVTVNLVVDNIGVVVLLVKMNDSNWTAWWTSEPTSWKRVHMGKGITYQQRDPYATVKASLVVPNELNNVLSSSSFCTSDASKSTIDVGDQLSNRLEYCIKDYNILLDREACKPFFSKDIPGDDGVGSKKTRMDNYVTDLCNPNSFQTRFKAQPAVQTLLNEFCACVSPLGLSGEIMRRVTGQSVSPVCFDTACISSGYKTKALLEVKCPTCMCTSIVNARNSSLSNVTQTCGSGCTDLSDRNSSVSTTATSNTQEQGSSNTGTYQSGSGTTLGVSVNGTTPTTTSSTNNSATTVSGSGSTSTSGGGSTSESGSGGGSTSESGSGSGSGNGNGNEPVTIDKTWENIIYVVCILVFVAFAIFVVAKITSKGGRESQQSQQTQQPRWWRRRQKANAKTNPLQ
jgi:hypothetical protein